MPATAPETAPNRATAPPAAVAPSRAAIMAALAATRAILATLGVSAKVEARQLAAVLGLTVEAATRAETLLSTALEISIEAGMDAPPEPTAPPPDHRRVHLMGNPPKIDSDPELRAFIAARIDHMTFVQIAEAVAGHFPPARHASKTAIHDRWTKHGKQGRAINQRLSGNRRQPHPASSTPHPIPSTIRPKTDRQTG